MKKLIVLLLPILTMKIVSGQICDAQQVLLTEDGECNYNPWVIVFEDNFDGNTLDLSKWTLPYQGVGRDFNHIVEKEWYVNTGSTPSIPFDNNIQVSNGTLKLISKRETVTGTYVTDWSTNPPTSKTETFDYTSAEIYSKYKFGYGMYEIRCKIPSGKGFWPAFWMYGEDLNKVNNEIDVFEFLNNSTSEHIMTVHYNGQACMTDYNGPDYSQAFHIFKVIWDNYKIEWYVDGNLKKRITKFTTLLGQPVDCNSLNAWSQYILDKVFPKDPMNIIANLALQTGTFQPDANTSFPSSLEIDYIRYSQRKGCTGVINATDITQLNLSNEIYNLINGTTITFGGNFVVPSTQQLELVARDEIILEPGFSSEAESDFVARINPSLCTGVVRIGNSTLDNTSQHNILFSTNSSIATSTISHTTKDFKIKLYPNPFKNQTNLDFTLEKSENVQLEIMDITGKSISKKDMGTLNAGKHREVIQAGDLESGSYMLRMNIGEKTNIQKIFILK